MTPEQIEERKLKAELKRAQAERAAEEAKAVLELPALRQAFAELRLLYLQAWRSSAPGDVAAREDAYLMTRAMEQLEGHLKTKVSGGQVVNFNLRGAVAPKQRTS